MDLWALIIIIQNKIMKKTRIVFSLTSRGFYSEITNMALAKLYADYYGLKFVVNTYKWNARIHRGLSDYYKSNLENINSFFSWELNVSTLEKIWFWKIYYNPKPFWNFYIHFFANKIYKLLHPHTLLSTDIWFKMRTKEFIDNKLDGNFVNMIVPLLKNLMSYNNAVNSFVENSKKKLCLPPDYISVHIRRGDKLYDREMNDIDFDRYVSEIRRHLNVSKNVFIATDDVSVIPIIKDLMINDNISIYYDKFMDQEGFDVVKFGQQSKNERQSVILLTILDLDILCHSSFFIGTYSSNVSRLVPIYIGFNKCVSLDYAWDLIFDYLELSEDEK
jgi:hypothetical protein